MKALIAMSGGVDSSTAACLMIEEGWECTGATMKLYSNEDIEGKDAPISAGHTCCSLDDVEDARQVAFRLGMKHYVFNFSDRFRETVIDDFIDCYRHCITPNPCINCNRYLKFDVLFRRMKELGMDAVVTGHYARIGYDEASGRYTMRKALDDTKDQTYVLYSLTQEQLAHIRLPLGELRKTQVREIAAAHDFINADKPDSQDICFVPDGKYAEFITRYTGEAPETGPFVHMDGRELGQHKGIIHYTIGQRKGLGIPAADPLYVVDIDPVTNVVKLGSNEDLFRSELIADDVNWVSIAPPAPGEVLEVTAKIRYRHKEQPAKVTVLADGRVRAEFHEPQRAITKGQALVMYRDDLVIGGGTIREIGY